MTVESGTLAEPKPFRVLVDEAMALTRRFFRPIYPSVAIPVSLISVFFTVVQSWWVSGFVKGSVGAKPDLSTILPGCMGVAVAILITVIVQTLANTAMVAACVDAVDGKAIDMGRSWRFVASARVLGTLLIVWILVGIGLILLILPGFYFMLVFSLTAVVMAAEGLFGPAALSRSKKLVSYNPEKKFIANPKTKIGALFLIAWIIGSVVGALVHLPFTIVQNLVMAHRISSGAPPDTAAMMRGMLWLQIPATFLSSLVSMAVAMYTSFGIALLFFDIRRRKEGIDLEEAIARLAGKTPAVEPGFAPSS